jgi:hypothetical protein
MAIGDQNGQRPLVVIENGDRILNESFGTHRDTASGRKPDPAWTPPGMPGWDPVHAPQGPLVGPGGPFWDAGWYS